MNDIDSVIYATLNEIYGNKLRTIVEREASTEDDVRCISFDAWYQDGYKVGIYAYYSFAEERVVDIYESAGENIGMPEPQVGIR